ncbi:MAG: DotU family type IV/VI secretion system protein, partial [Terrimicrobiaceae bacterium]
MTLFDLYEPLFQYICMLNRIARKGSNEAIEYDSLRTEIVSMLDSINKRAQTDPLLALQAKKLEMPVTFFVDSMISESNLQCAAQWHKNRIAYLHNELAGDEKFFDLLDETLNDPSPEATERLFIYYVCMGLGFTGWYAGQPEYLRRKMETVAKRIGVDELNKAARICPEAYEHVDS